MKINVHAGHNPSGKVASGAVGFLNESNEARKVKDLIIKKLKSLGHTVYDCTVSNGTSQNDVLYKIVSKCNAHAVDIDVSIHFNSGRDDSKGDGKTGGVEVWTYPACTKPTIAERIVKEVAALGFNNRGVKTTTSLYFLRKTKATAFLAECCFVDDKDDFELYNAEKMATAIVKGITGKTVREAKNAEFKVKLKEDLNIRETPDLLGKIIKKDGAKKGYVYTIVEKNGDFGLLKSYADKRNGWIKITDKYVDKIN